MGATSSKARILPKTLTNTVKTELTNKTKIQAVESIESGEHIKEELSIPKEEDIKSKNEAALQTGIYIYNLIFK